MKLHVKLIAIAAIMLSFASCKNSNKEGRNIPATASFAVHINSKSLSEKLPWSEIKSNPLFENVYSDSNVSAAVKKILDNPDNSGIDTKSDLIFFIQRDAEGGYGSLLGSIKDEAAFKTISSEIVKEGTASEKNGISMLSNGRECLGWNKERFVLVSDMEGLAKMDQLSRRMMQDSIDIRSGKSRDLVTTCQSVFSLEESKSLGKNEKFGKLVNEKGDIHFWINTEEISKNTASASMLAMVNLDKLYKGNYATGTINFDNGKINVSMKNYLSDEMSKLYEKYGGGKVDEEMLKRIPGKEVMGVMALNFKPEGLKEFLKILNVDGMANIQLKRLGFTVDDFVKANKGDIVVGFSDVSRGIDTTEGMGMPKTNFNFVFGASIGDKAAFDKLVAAGKRLSGGMEDAGGKAPFAYSMNGTYFAISNTQQNADAYINGKGADFDFISKITGEPMSGYLNIQSLMKAFGDKPSSDSLDKIIYDASLKTWDNILFKGGDYKDGAAQSNFEINLMDKNTNSLKQLNQYLIVISKVMKDKEKKRKEDMMALEDALKSGSLGEMPEPDKKSK